MQSPLYMLITIQYVPKRTPGDNFMVLLINLGDKTVTIRHEKMAMYCSLHKNGTFLSQFIHVDCWKT
jgi:hypothetical protein